MMTELGRRAAASKNWRWMPGMRCTDGSRMLRTGDDLDGPWQAWSDEHYDACACKMRPHETANDLPDLTDPATVGCLLALVREAWGDPYVYATGFKGRREIWVVHVPSDRHNIHGEGETEVEALVAALEAAP